MCAAEPFLAMLYIYIYTENNRTVVVTTDSRHTISLSSSLMSFVVRDSILQKSPETFEKCVDVLSQAVNNLVKNERSIHHLAEDNYK